MNDMGWNAHPVPPPDPIQAAAEVQARARRLYEEQAYAAQQRALHPPAPVAGRPPASRGERQTPARLEALRALVASGRISASEAERLTDGGVVNDDAWREIAKLTGSTDDPAVAAEAKPAPEAARHEARETARRLLRTRPGDALQVFAQVEIPPRMPFMALKYGWAEVDRAWPVGTCQWRYRRPHSAWEHRLEHVGLDARGDLRVLVDVRDPVPMTGRTRLRTVADNHPAEQPGDWVEFVLSLRGDEQRGAASRLAVPYDTVPGGLVTARAQAADDRRARKAFRRAAEAERRRQLPGDR
jgi:hypothetical protein